eukprot:tig00000923_g5465.t1
MDQASPGALAMVENAWRAVLNVEWRKLTQGPKYSYWLSWTLLGLTLPGLFFFPIAGAFSLCGGVAGLTAITMRHRKLALVYAGIAGAGAAIEALFVLYTVVFGRSSALSDQCRAQRAFESCVKECKNFEVEDVCDLQCEKLVCVFRWPIASLLFLLVSGAAMAAAARYAWMAATDPNLTVLRVRRGEGGGGPQGVSDLLHRDDEEGGGPAAAPGAPSDSSPGAGIGW